MLIAAVIVQIAFAIGGPIALAVWVARRFQVRPVVFAAGAVAFIGSQIVHVPLLIGLTLALKPAHIPEQYVLGFNAVVLGLLAGACEEPARYLVYRFWLRDARTYGDAIALGTGHGGVESMLLVGVNGIVNLVLLLHPPKLDALPPEAATAIRAMLTAPPYMPLLAVVERALAIVMHLAFSVLVLQCFTRKNVAWLFAAIGLHALVDGIAVVSTKTLGPGATEGVIATLTLVCVAILLRLRPKPATPPPPSP